MPKRCYGQEAAIPFRSIQIKLLQGMISILILLITTITTSFASKIVELDINGPIGPATADYIERGMLTNNKADLILVIINTPGGLSTATQTIIRDFLTSKVPVLTYVSPDKAQAANVGTYLVYAGTLAAMAPKTQLGAPSSIHLDENLYLHKSNARPGLLKDHKLTADTLTALQTLAKLRGKDANFVQNALINTAFIPAEEALKKGLINVIALDKYKLLEQVNGLAVTQNNQKITLNTANPEIEVMQPDWYNVFLSIITHPTIAYLLVLLGIYGIFFELVNPGYIFPGVAGAFSMLLALYALQLLPVNYAGLLLIILGIAFIIAEGFTPSFGVLGIGGSAAFILGSIMLINTDYMNYQIAWPSIWVMSVINIVFFVFLIGMVIKARRQITRNGLIQLVGAKGRAFGNIHQSGQAVIRGEIWSVYSKKPIQANTNIVVVLTKGLLLEVMEDLPTDDETHVANKKE